MVETRCELAVIGTGLAGLSSAFFAVARGIDTTLVGMTGPLIFASGLLDLLAVHPIQEKRQWEDPWKGIEMLVRDEPGHPYAYLHRESMRRAMDEMMSFLGDHGMPYVCDPSRNLRVLTAMGTIKLTYGVPLTMGASHEAITGRKPCLVVGVEGLKGFSARQVVEILGAEWPGLRSCRLVFPASGTEIFPERIAGALESSEGRARFVQLLEPSLDGVEFVAIPAVCGVEDHAQIFLELQSLLGKPLFEIPTMPPSLTGKRLKAVFETSLPNLGVECHLQQKVLSARYDGSGFSLECGTNRSNLKLKAACVVLATGRFFGGGLRSGTHGVEEPLFGLPISPPLQHEAWRRRDFLHPAGHPVNRCGVRVDRLFRPLSPEGRPVHEGLFAAGAILAGHDWPRSKCGAGLAITTSYAAVESASRFLSS